MNCKGGTERWGKVQSKKTGLGTEGERGEEGQTNTFSFFFQSKEKRKPVQTFLSKRKVY